MLIDDVRESVRTDKGNLLWIGLDTRFDLGEDLNYQPVDVGQKERKLLLGILEEATMYDCSPLDTTLAEQWKDRTIRFVRDCIGPLPPFPVTGLESKSGVERSLVLLQSSAVTEPVNIIDHFLLDNALARPGYRGDRINQAKFTDSTQVVPLPEAKWMVSVSVLIGMPDAGEFIFVDNFGAYFCDSHGQLLTSLIANRKLNARLTMKPDAETTQFLEKAVGAAMARFNLSVRVLNLMACKNVSSEVRLADEKLQHARQRRGKEPLAEYRILTVTLPGNAKRGTDAKTITAHAGEPMPLQTIPGQYRDYRENGLFGKYKGIFWVPAFIKGSVEAGEIKKGYTVKAVKHQGEAVDGTVTHI